MAKSKSPDSVQFEKSGAIASLKLNAPESLNALTLDMVERLTEYLADCKNDPAIQCVILSGEGPKSFCAGGDVKQVCQTMKDAGPDYGDEFFAAEYRLDYLIHRFPKALVTIAHGMTLGGGIGLLAGSSIRVLTEDVVLAMPEISIGFFADVGASYFLNLLPGKIGLYLALTGYRMTASDAILCGLADASVKKSALEPLREDLSKIKWTGSRSDNLTLIKNELKKHQLPLLPSVLMQNKDWIEQACAGDRIEIICKNLLKFPAKAGDLAQGSPTSIRLIFEQFKKGKSKSLAECFRMELGLAYWFLRGHDFYEGVRAKLLDKTGQPRWRPAKLEMITDGEVARYFRSPWESARGSHPLSDLETRS